MDHLYSEQDLVQNNDLVWGQWQFSLSNDEIEHKLKRLTVSDVEDEDYRNWCNLFGITKHFENVTNVSKTSLAPQDCEMESSPSAEEKFDEPVDHDVSMNNRIDGLVMSLVDLCNEAAPKLRHGLACIHEEMNSIKEDISNLNGDVLKSCMLTAWSQLTADAAKFCFCIPFTTNADLCKSLCENVLLPWLKKSLPNKIEQLSEILALEGESVSRYLVAPLLNIEDSPLSKDTVALEELMHSMLEKHWTLLLKDFLSGIRELDKRQIPILALIMNHAKPSNDDVNLVIQLMSSTGTVFAQKGDFGSLLVTVANKVSKNAGTLVAELKRIATNYKGPLKFKILKILDEVKN